MSWQVRIAIVGDRDPTNLTHLATEASLDHAAAALGVDLSRRWVPTPDLAAGAGPVLAGDAGLWIEERYHCNFGLLVTAFVRGAAVAAGRPSAPLSSPR